MLTVYYNRSKSDTILITYIQISHGNDYMRIREVEWSKFVFALTLLPNGLATL